MSRRARARLAALVAAAAVGAGGGAGAAAAPNCEIALASGPSWKVYASEPSGVASPNLLGAAQPVCLWAPGTPGCAPDAVSYGYPYQRGGSWGANISAIGGAVWVWGPGTTLDKPADLARFVFVRSFDLPPGARGVLLIAADDFAEVRVNGTRLGSLGSVDDIAAATRSQASLARFDLAPYLVAGKNTISITAQNGPASYAGGCAGLPCTYRQNPAGVIFGGALGLCPQETETTPLAPKAVPSPGKPTACTTAAAGFTGRDATPLGQWSFGWSASVGSAFVPYAPMTPPFPEGTGVERLARRMPESATHPVAFFNATSAVQYPEGTLTIQPGQLALHPGARGEYSIARFRAAVGGRRDVAVEFFGLSGPTPAGPPRIPPTTTDVHVLLNGTRLASGVLNLQGKGNAFRYGGYVHVEPGDVVDFLVGRGNGAYEYDSTAVDAVICPGTAIKD